MKFVRKGDYLTEFSVGDFQEGFLLSHCLKVPFKPGGRRNQLLLHVLQLKHTNMLHL